MIGKTNNGFVATKSEDWVVINPIPNMVELYTIFGMTEPVIDSFNDWLQSLFDDDAVAYIVKKFKEVVGE